MRSLIMIAHGSNNQSAVDSFFELSEIVKSKIVGAKTAGDFGSVSHAFLEISSPSLDEVIDRQIEQGAQDIFIFPYFLGPGNHVIRDIPLLVQQARVRHPGTKFHITKYFGEHRGIPTLIAELIQQSQA